MKGKKEHKELDPQDQLIRLGKRLKEGNYIRVGTNMIKNKAGY